MSKLKKVLSIVTITLVSAVIQLYAEKTPVEDLYSYTLDNDLSLFVAEDHSVPLVYIDIAVRAGATTQTPETAGLFHLYEHMMFKGNELYPNAAAVQRAVKDMGVSKWNAFTQVDCVHYYFTLPSDQLENGMAFWNAAIRSPLMDEQELEVEKKVVLSELQGDYKDNSSFLSDYITNAMFQDSPYRLDPAGSYEVVKKSTVAQLRDIQSKYYIPANAALFIGGDVSPEEVYDLTKKIFGTWSNNGNKAPELPPQPSLNPFESAKKAALVIDSKSYEKSLNIIYRAPDLEYNEKDSYTADYIATLLNEWSEDFKQALIKQKRYEFKNPNDIQVSCISRRAGSLFYITVDNPLMLDEHLVDEILKVQIPNVISKSYAFSPEKKEFVVSKLKASHSRSVQSTEGLLSTMREYWASASPEYYYNYYDNIRNVTKEDAQEWVKKYITDSNPLILKTVTSYSYEMAKANVANNGGRKAAEVFTLDVYLGGYEQIKEKQAKWWKNKKFLPDPNKIAKDTGTPKKTPIYVPSKDMAASKKYMVYEPPKVISKTLKNNIPVYFLQDDKKEVNYVHIGVRGGPTYLDSKKFSGLEETLFECMTMNSRVYSEETRLKVTTETRSTIRANTYREGSVLSLGTTDAFLYKALPVFLDGFMHPMLKSSMYNSIVACAKADILSARTEPIAFLDSKIMDDVTKNHPYEKSNTITSTSLDYIEYHLGDWIDAANTLYNDIIRPENIFVVVSGNVDENKLVAELDKTLGTIQSKSSKTSKDKKKDKKKNRDNEALQAELAGVVTPYVISGDDEVVTFQNIASGTGHAIRVVSAPAENSDDYLASLMAADMYNDMLYNVVREHYGACYTPSVYVAGGKASLGVEQLYKMSNLEKFNSYVKEARDYMAQGKLIDSVGKDGKYVFSSIDKRLQSYKNAQVIATYSPQASVQGMGASLVYDLLTYNEMFHSRNALTEIHDATADEVLSVFKKYWVDAPSKWWVVVNEDDELIVDFD